VLQDLSTDRSVEKFITLWSVTYNLHFRSVHQ